MKYGGYEKLKKAVFAILLIIAASCFNGCGSSKEQPLKEDVDLLPKFRSVQEYYNLANVAGQNGKIDLAIKNYKRAIEINPGHAPSYASLGLAYAKKGDAKNGDAKNADYKTAMSFLLKGVELDDKLAFAHYNLGVLYAKLGKSAEAEASLKRAVELDPKDALSYSMLSSLYTKLGDDQKASFYMKKYVDLVPNDAYSHYNLGVYYLEKGIKDSALEEFQAVLKFDPNFKEAYFQIGVIYHNESNIDKAIEMYKKTLALDSTYINACVNLGDLYYFEKNDLANALYYYNKSLSIDFNHKYARKMITKIQDEGKR